MIEILVVLMTLGVWLSIIISVKRKRKLTRDKTTKVIKNILTGEKK